MYLERINSPSDLKKLSIRELEIYSGELKNYIIKVVTENGGHLASNLGVIDLTVAMHYVFDCPEDKFIFDVGHQTYAHKIITGRREQFDKLRTSGGISGFEKASESIFDAFTMGHSSTSLSAALGFARARDVSGQKYNVVALIGDGALTGGMAYEAVNDIGSSGTPLIIILNDNSMSISKNVGAISSHLGKLRLSRRYKKMENSIKSGVDGLPIVGESLMRFFSTAKAGVRTLVSTNKMFEQFGIKYYGAFDGHNIGETVGLLANIKHSKKPVLLHFVTTKGKGLHEAEIDPEKYHGLDSRGSLRCNKYSKVVSKTLVRLAKNDDKVVAVGAAMLGSTGLAEFKAAYPTRCYDVGIAEQHAVTMAAGMAAGGLKPYFTVYSSFLQRGFDQLLHDVCIPMLPVRLLIDRAGIVGADGVTHQGLFDLSYLGILPNMTVLTPKSGAELDMMLEWSLTYDKPLAIRYPKGYGDDLPAVGKNPLVWEVVRGGDKAYVLCAGGRMLSIALKANGNATIVNCRAVKPLDNEFLDGIGDGSLVVTMEDNVLRGGFGRSVGEHLSGRGIKVINLGVPDCFVEEMDIQKSLAAYGLTVENLNSILKRT